jgi:predicted ferric reductase
MFHDFVLYNTVMHETSLELVQRLIAKGQSTEEIRTALNEAIAAGTHDYGELSPKTSPPGDTAQREAPVRAPIIAAALSPKSQSNAAPAIIPALVAPAPFHRRLAAGLGWPMVLAVCFIPVIAMIADVPFATRFGSWSATLLTIGDATGVIGLGMYAMNLVLATRMRWLEDFFGGLNQVIINHQLLGGFALVMLLIHPMASAISYYPYGIHTVAHFFVPQMAYIGTAFGIIALVMMVLLVGISFYMKLAYKLWLYTHKYLGVAYAFVALHVLLTPNKITSDSFVKWYLWALLLVGAVAYIYRTLLPNIFVRRYVYTIAGAQSKGIGVMEVTLAPVGERVRFRAGQFIFVSFGGDGFSEEWHPFSVSSAETSANLMIDVKSLGIYTEALTRLLPSMIGMTARVEGAYGRFTYRNFANMNQVWIAGGIGVTPFLSMAQSFGPEPYNIDLYYSVKTVSELVDLDTLASRQSAKPNQVFRTFPYITETYKAHLNAEILAKNSGDLSKRDFLLCGPPAMMQAIRKQLMGLGVRPSQIHSEEFSLE